MSWQDEIDAIVATFPPIPDDPLEYRIHYDEFGNITMCSMQQHPENSQYLVVDKETYDNYFRSYVNVRRKRLEKVAFDPGLNVKLKKSHHGYAVVKHHAGLILESDEAYTDIEYYDDN